MSSNRILNADDIQGINVVRNYIKNDGANINTNGWVTYADAAGNIPVDGTGGSPTVTWTRTTSSPLSLDASFLFTKDAANRQGQGASYDFTTNLSDRSQPLQIEFNYSIASGTFAGAVTPGSYSDLIVYIYDVTNSQLIQPAGILLDGSVIGQQYKYRGIFQANSNSSSYRLILHCATTSASAYTVNFDDVKVSRQISSSGAVVTDWQSYTPTGAVATNTTFTGKWRRVGDLMEVQARAGYTGAPTGLTGVTFTIPTGYTIDTAKLTQSDSGKNVGRGEHVNTGNANYTTVVTYTNTTTVSVFTQAPATSTAAVSLSSTSATAPFTIANGHYTDVTFYVPIVGWSSNVQMSNDTDTRVVAVTASSKLPTGTLSGTLSVTVFGSVDFDTHGAYNTTTGLYTVPVAGYYDCTAILDITSASISAGQAYSAGFRVNGTTTYFRIYRVFETATAATDQTFTVSGVIKLNAGDTLAVVATAGTTTPTYSSGLSSSSFAFNRLSGPAQIASTESISASYFLTTNQAINGEVQLSGFTKVFDTHSAFSSDQYVAPISGTYSLKIQALAGSGTNNQVCAYKVNSGTTVYIGATTAGNRTGGADLLYLNAGDNVKMYMSTAGSNTFSSGRSNTFFSIFRTGN